MDDKMLPEQPHFRHQLKVCASLNDLLSRDSRLRTAGGELNVEALRSAPAVEGSAQTVGEALSDLVGTVRENMQLRRAYRFYPTSLAMFTTLPQQIPMTLICSREYWYPQSSC